MIKDRRAFTENDENYFEDLSLEEQKVIKQWIYDNFVPRKTLLRGHTSYGLKHIFSSNTGIYVTNNQFKDAMLKSGYKPVDSNELNWRYCLRKDSPAFDLWRLRK